MCSVVFSPADDLRLNSRVFHWPNQILIELDDSKLRLATFRKQTVDYLQKRLLIEPISHVVSHKWRPPVHVIHPDTTQSSTLEVFEFNMAVNLNLGFKTSLPNSMSDV